VVLAAQVVVDLEKSLDVAVLGIERVEGKVRKKFLDKLLGELDFVLSKLLPIR